MIWIGTRFGPYEIVAAIGSGGMGEVYRARDTKLDRDVAIKVLPDLADADPERLMRFEREAKTLAAFNHQNIAQVHGVIEHPPALVMEFVDGEDLSARITLESPASPPASLVPRAGISTGLAALLVLGALVVGALGAWTLRHGPPARGSAARLSLPIGPAESLVGAFVLSDDGSHLAFVGQRSGTNHIFLRPLAEDDAKVVPGTEGVALVGPAFSPDGRWLVFTATGTLKKVPVDGAPAVILAENVAGSSRLEKPITRTHFPTARLYA